MKQEEKQLLLVDLCARLPFRICANLPNHHLVSHMYIIHDINIQNGWTNGILYCAGREQIYGAKIEDIQPYLRPMSSMTEEENKKLDEIWLKHTIVEGADYLNSIHVDYRGLIEKGLALAVTKDNNPYEN